MFRKILSAILAVILITISLNIDTEAESVSTNLINNKPMKVAVLLMNFTDQYISLVRENLEEIQKENPEKVQFTFYDAKSNQAIQNEQIDTVLKKGTDLILLHLVNNTNEATVENVITDIKRTNTPVILFNREPISSILLRSYPKAVYIGLDAKQDGIKQGEILINEWNTNRDFIDKNNDNIMEYIILGGERDNIVTKENTQYSISTIENAGIKTEELATTFAYWDRNFAKEIMESFFLKEGNNIEVVIANDDSMALGAIDALQSFGYNLGDKEKTIAVVGVEGLPEAQELIKKNMMLGTVFQDPKALAQALYTVGMNLVQNKAPLENTQYKFDKTNVSIRIPNEIMYKQD